MQTLKNAQISLRRVRRMEGWHIEILLMEGWHVEILLTLFGITFFDQSLLLFHRKKSSIRLSCHFLSDKYL